jgi:hypothetical protein
MQLEQGGLTEAARRGKTTQQCKKRDDHTVAARRGTITQLEKRGLTAAARREKTTQQCKKRKDHTPAAKECRPYNSFMKMDDYKAAARSRMTTQQLQKKG